MPTDLIIIDYLNTNVTTINYYSLTLYNTNTIYYNPYTFKLNNAR